MGNYYISFEVLNKNCVVWLLMESESVVLDGDVEG
jgi:hypothetical protein